MYLIRHKIPLCVRITLLKSFVFSHFTYSLVLLKNVAKSEAGFKSLRFRTKFDSSKDLLLKFKYCLSNYLFKSEPVETICNDIPEMPYLLHFSTEIDPKATTKVKISQRSKMYLTWKNLGNWGELSEVKNNCRS